LEALGKSEPFDVVLLDMKMPQMDGLEVLSKILQHTPTMPVVMVTAITEAKPAVQAMKMGAYDYLQKPFDVDEIRLVVDRILKEKALEREVGRLRTELQAVSKFENIIGSGPAMQKVYALLQRVMDTDTTVLVLGETGTGKELVARALHYNSVRREGPFIAVHCAAIPGELLESELFGHEKGAFTGALKQKPGRVEEADAGTIFLDEIADMSRSLQAKLLRFLEDGTFMRVGGTQELQVNVRLIAATNRDIIEAIRGGQFREDLFHRLNVVQLRLSPLRERGEDVSLLAEYFLRSFSVSMNKNTRTISRAALQKLLSHHWPGNVRELRNVIERALILETTSEIQPVSLPDFQLEGRLHKTAAPKLAGAESLDDRMANFERELITAMLEQNHFSLTRTAEQLKISRHALRYRMQRLNIAAGTETEEDAAAIEKKDLLP
jgi:DNA-binding NtrC family response regulator